MRGQFPEFLQRTIVRITTDRRLAQRLNDVVLLDFEVAFFRYLISVAQMPDFGGTYAPIYSSGEDVGALVAYRVRWQNDQGDPLVHEFVVLHANGSQPVAANPAFLTAWLRQEAQTAQRPNPNLSERKDTLFRLRQAAEVRLAAESSRFKHPNGLVLLAAADLAATITETRL